MKFKPVLNFSGPEASCYSLRVLAEHARRGDIQIRSYDTRDETGYMRIDFDYTPMPTKQ